MEFVNLLEKLDFSFWQLLIIGFAIFMRHEVRTLFNRLAIVRVGNREFTFHEDKTVKDLNEIKQEVKSNSADPVKIIELIDEKIDKKIISALGEIKRETRFLWPAIESLKDNIESKAEIQNETLERIKLYLRLMEDAGLLTYDIDYIGPQQYGLRVIRLKKLDHTLERLIATVSNTRF